MSKQSASGSLAGHFLAGRAGASVVLAADRGAHEPPIKAARSFLHRQRAGSDPPRDGHALRPVSVAGGWHFPAHLARRSKEQPAENPARVRIMMDRGLVEIRTTETGPRAFVTAAALED